jgi:hypothetical protein
MEMYGDKKSLAEFCVELCVSAILLTEIAGKSPDKHGYHQCFVSSLYKHKMHSVIKNGKNG